MAKKESTFINMFLTMLIVSSVAALALGGVHMVTKGPIALNQNKVMREALEHVLPQFDNNITEEMHTVALEGEDPVNLYVAENDGEMVGVAVESYSNKGYSGRIKIMVGFLPDGTINNISVLDHKETPGLGDKMEKSKSEWSKQYNDKHPDETDLRVAKDGGDIDAITAATISSRAYSDAVQRAYDAFIKEIKGGEE
ncbi:MAG: RnfABCDGE type electron transport complex subunit G [Bacteroidales bacterium]